MLVINSEELFTLQLSVWALITLLTLQFKGKWRKTSTLAPINDRLSGTQSFFHSIWHDYLTLITFYYPSIIYKHKFWKLHLMSRSKVTVSYQRVQVLRNCALYIMKIVCNGSLCYFWVCYKIPETSIRIFLASPCDVLRCDVCYNNQ